MNVIIEIDSFIRKYNILFVPTRFYSDWCPTTANLVAADTCSEVIIYLPVAVSVNSSCCLAHNWKTKFQ